MILAISKEKAKIKKDLNSCFYHHFHFVIRSNKISVVEKKMVVDKTLYDVLEVDQNATQETITKVRILSEFF